MQLWSPPCRTKKAESASANTSLPYSQRNNQRSGLQTDDHVVWKSLSRPERDPVDDLRYRTDLIDFLANLACKDNTKGAWLAQGVVKRYLAEATRLPRLKDQSVRLYEHLIAKDCAPGQMIPALLMGKLKASDDDQQQSADQTPSQSR